MRAGLVVSGWNGSVEEHAGEGLPTLAGVKVSKLSCYLDGYRDRLCRDVEHLADLIENLQGSARAQAAYFVDMAKAEALDLLGDSRQAFELADRHA